jgi:methionyl-tRNA formyltransferase
MIESSQSKLVRKIAVIAKHSFYFDDIKNELQDLELQIECAEEISEIQKKVGEGEHFDFIFFPHYSKIIPTQFLEGHTCIGFHTGDLPQDRGGSPIQHKILRAEYSTRVSAIRLTHQVDAGDIFSQEFVSLEHGSIEKILRNISKIIATLIRYILVENPEPIPQIGPSSSFPRLSFQTSKLNIEELELRQIYDKIRMLDGLDYPSAYIEIGRYRVYLSGAELHDNHLTFTSILEEIK